MANEVALLGLLEELDEAPDLVGVPVEVIFVEDVGFEVAPAVGACWSGAVV